MLYISIVNTAGKPVRTCLDAFSPPSSPPRDTPRSQQYLECEYSQLIFGEGGARAVSYPVRKLCALLPLPRFAALQPRLVTHVGLLASLWLPRYASAYVEFFQDTVELLQVCGRGYIDVFRACNWRRGAGAAGLGEAWPCPE